MSGHSKWANIKNRKGAQDKKRSETFTRMSKGILTALRLGGGNTNPEVNLHLKAAIDKAREVNMPKENIGRLVERFESRRNSLVSMTLEGYGPFGVPIIIEIETDNKNRTLGEIKLIFRNYGVNLGEANSVGFMFERVGEMAVGEMSEEQKLGLIDIGVIDFGEGAIYTKPEELGKIQEQVVGMGIGVEGRGLVMRCKQPVSLGDEGEVGRVLNLVEELEGHDDVINVFSGFEYNGQKN